MRVFLFYSLQSGSTYISEVRYYKNLYFNMLPIAKSLLLEYNNIVASKDLFLG